ncbi:lysine--tRNA ligase [Candidatus Curculioniphilus buchneri]|uniref:lysine--tRNA ligase n=1 Tax=Candidatus Curculioniphilus buchneri TaxID=690594 RepID=UPI00376EC043
MSELYLKNNISQDLKLNNELRIRREKLIQLRQKSIAFPNDFRRDTITEQLHECYGEKSNNELEKLDITVNIAGRMMSRRIMGKVAFVTLQDVSGKIQLYVTCNNLSNDIYNEHFKQWDLGDILGVHGKLFKTRTGELSVRCYKIRLLTKAIRPLPDKFHGLTNQEICYRQRYLDLIANDYSRRTFKLRSHIIAEIRRFMIDREFMEVETPMMQPIPGGASARPFITYHNELNHDMYLRVAPELYLKQLVIGGFERIFEINRNFRNEGLSTYHNPEFTMMELYMAYADYRDLMSLVEDLFRTLTKRVLGTRIVRYGDKVFDFNKPFTKMTMKEMICHYCPDISSESLNDKVSITSVAKSLGIDINKSWEIGLIQTKIFEEIANSHLIQPTFVTNYPASVSPLARRNDENPFFTERFEFFIGGLEIGNGFSELNDPEDQAIRFTEQIQSKHNNNVDITAMFYDNDYITALEYGLPPTAGLGIGIDRLVMLLTNRHTIRDVIFFPVLRPKK